jgi:hypothetical protein
MYIGCLLAMVALCAAGDASNCAYNRYNSLLNPWIVISCALLYRVLCNRFDLSPEQILAALASPDLAIEPVPDVELPQHLVDPQEIEATVEVRIEHSLLCLLLFPLLLCTCCA